jgi:hypothetical protein
MKQTRYVARTGRYEKYVQNFGCKVKGMRPRGRSKSRWDDNIKMDLKELQLEGVNWIHLSQDRIQWRVLVNSVLKIRVS